MCACCGYVEHKKRRSEEASRASSHNEARTQQQQTKAPARTKWCESRTEQKNRTYCRNLRDQRHQQRVPHFVVAECVWRVFAGKNGFCNIQCVRVCCSRFVRRRRVVCVVFEPVAAFKVQRACLYVVVFFVLVGEEVDKIRARE